MSGRVYSAREMYDLGVVDEIVEDGAGLESTRLLIKARQRRRNSYRAMSEAKRELMPVSHAEMRAIVDIWVDAALALEERDQRMMGRLVRAQDKLMSSSQDEQDVAELYESVPQVANA